MEPDIIKIYYKSYYNSELVGKLILGSDGVNLIGLWFENQKILLEDKNLPQVSGHYQQNHWP